MPAPGAAVSVTKNVILDGDRSVGSLTIKPGASVTFNPGRSQTLSSTGNIVVEGTLVMRPATTAQVHRLVFANVNETRFVGGGEVPLASDVGLWVMGAGQLDLQGAPKTAWLRAAGDIAAGTRTVTLASAPAGWVAGDEIAISPTESPAVGVPSYEGFDNAVLGGVSNSTLTLASPTGRAHPRVNGAYTAEVMNLTRNVRVEGTAAGRAHIFVRSSRPQTINYTAIRWMGANKSYRTGDGLPLIGAMGRYSLHFHRSHDGSRGSVVDGTVVRDGGAQSFAPHESHGITFRNCISYNTYRSAFWWDSQTATNDTTVDGCIAARIRPTGDFKYRLTGFVHDTGNGNSIRNSVAVGIASGQGDDDSAGFFWPEISGAGVYSGVWNWRDNVSHNNRMNGMFVWQNTGVHTVTNYVGYNNGRYGIRHGAYNNSYQYVGGVLYANLQGAIELKAVGPARFENMVIDGAGLSPGLVRTVRGAGESTNHMLFRNVTMRGQTAKAFWLSREGFTAEGRDHIDLIDVVDSTIAGNPFYLENVTSAKSRIRVQNGTTAYEVVRADQGGTLVAAWNAKRRPIAAFPTVTITSPVSDVVITGDTQLTVTVKAAASPIDRVEFYRNGGLIGTARTAPYSFTLLTTALSEGSHALQAKVYDKAGNVSSMSGISVRLQRPR